MENSCLLCKGNTLDNVADPRLSPSEGKAFCKLLQLPLFPFEGEIMKVGFCEGCKNQMGTVEEIYEAMENHNSKLASMRTKLQNKFAWFSRDHHLQPGTSRQSGEVSSGPLLEIRNLLFKQLQDISQRELDKVDAQRKMAVVPVSTQSDPTPGRSVEVQSDITRIEVETQTMEPIPNNKPHSEIGLESQSQSILRVDSSQQPSCSWTNPNKARMESPQIPDTSNRSASTIELSITENAEDNVTNNIKGTLIESVLSSDAFNSEDPISGSLTQPSQEHTSKFDVNDADALDTPIDGELVFDELGDMQVATIDINTSETPTIIGPKQNQSLSDHNASSDPETDDEMSRNDTADNVDVTILQKSKVPKKSGHEKPEGPPSVSVSNNMPKAVVKLTHVSVNVIKTEIANEIQVPEVNLGQIGNNDDEEVVVIDEVTTPNAAENNVKKKRGRPKKNIDSSSQDEVTPRKTEYTAAKKMKQEIKISSGNKQAIHKNKSPQISRSGRVVKKKESPEL